MQKAYRRFVAKTVYCEVLINDAHYTILTVEHYQWHKQKKAEAKDPFLIQSESWHSTPSIHNLTLTNKSHQEGTRFLWQST